MIVGFLHARQDPVYARLMVASVRRHMPDATIVQWTDYDTPEVEGVDRCERKHWDGRFPMLLKMGFLANTEGDVLALDTDVLVKADLRPVFGFPFDVALTWRDGPIRDPEGNDITKVMPVNCGVMWSRSRTYWQACLRWCDINDVRDWYADQLAVANVRGFDVLRLHCDNFNYTPLRADEDVSSRLAVHYKGKRKEWML
jgi:hypothetical protein